VRYLISLCLLIGSLTGSHHTAAGELNAPIDERFSAYLDGLVAAQFSDYKLAGLTLVMVKDGQVAMQKGFGYADLETTTPVDPQRHLFRPGSVSKLFTWTAVMQLVERGQLDLNADVSTYVPQFEVPNEFDQPITLTHILTHTPGLEDGAAGYLFGDSEDDLMPLAQSLAKYTPAQVRAPGTYSAYSNWATALAGLIVANVSGMSFEDYVQQQIFAPLGMQQATFDEPLPARLADDMSTGYVTRQGGLDPLGFEYIKNFGPAGAMSASAGAMAPFMIAHLNQGRFGEVQLLEPETTTLMHSNLFSHHPRSIAWAHGFYEYRRNGQRFIGHGGDTIAFHSQMVLDLDNNFGFYLSFNAAEGARARTAIVDGIIDYFYPPTPIGYDYEPLPGSAERIAQAAGAYRVNRRSYTKLEGITALAGDLPIVPAGEGAISIPLPVVGGRYIETEPYVFTEQSGQGVITFGTDAEGNVTHAFLGMVAADKVTAAHQAGNHQLIILLALLASLFVVINAVRNRAEELSGPALWGNRSVVGAAVCNLLLVVGLLAIGAAGFDMDRAIFDFPPAGTSAVLVFPIFSLVFTIAALILLVPVWMSPQCGVWARIRYTYVALVFTALCLVFNYWNMIGWNYF